MAAKEYTYLVTLKKNVDLKVNIISLILLFIAFCVFAFIGFRYSTVSIKEAVTPFVVCLFIICWIIFCITSKRPKYYRLALLVAGVYFFYSPLGFSWIGILYVLAGLFEKQAKFPSEIGFDEEGVSTNSIPRREYEWSELRNVMIRDSLLTIDFNSNKLYQKEIQNVVSAELELEFNAFCLKQLQIAQNNRSPIN